MTDPASVNVIVHGHVQGVFFRAFTRGKATELELTGYVRNSRIGNVVEVKAEGERNKLEILINSLKTGPPGARVDRLEINWVEYSGEYSDFTVRY